MIAYYTQDSDFKFSGKRPNNRWIDLVCSSENRRVGEIGIIFCSDKYILGVNNQYLHHNFYTDIITFNYCDGDKISGDLFISIDSVRDNAVTYGETFQRELRRVIVHGILHLIGYDDHTDEEKKVMREKEDQYLALLSESFELLV